MEEREVADRTRLVRLARAFQASFGGALGAALDFSLAAA